MKNVRLALRNRSKVRAYVGDDLMEEINESIEDFNKDDLDLDTVTDEATGREMIMISKCKSANSSIIFYVISQKYNVATVAFSGFIG